MASCQLYILGAAGRFEIRILANSVNGLLMFADSMEYIITTKSCTTISSSWLELA